MPSRIPQRKQSPRFAPKWKYALRAPSIEATFPERMNTTSFEKVLQRHYHPMLQLKGRTLLAFCSRNNIGFREGNSRILSHADMVRLNRIAARTADLFHSGDFLTATQLGKAIKPGRSDVAAKGAVLSALKNNSAKATNPETGKTEIMPRRIPFIRIDPGTTIGADYSRYVFPRHLVREFPSIFNPGSIKATTSNEAGKAAIRKTGKRQKEISEEADAKRLEHELRVKSNARIRAEKKYRKWLERQLHDAEKLTNREQREKEAERRRQQRTKKAEERKAAPKAAPKPATRISQAISAAKARPPATARNRTTAKPTVPKKAQKAPAKKAPPKAPAKSASAKEPTAKTPKGIPERPAHAVETPNLQGTAQAKAPAVPLTAEKFLAEAERVYRRLERLATHKTTVTPQTKAELEEEVRNLKAALTPQSSREARVRVVFAEGLLPHVRTTK